MKLSKRDAAKLLHQAHRTTQIAQGVDPATLPTWENASTAVKNAELARVKAYLLSGTTPDDTAFPDISAADDIMIALWPVIMVAIGA